MEYSKAMETLDLHRDGCVLHLTLNRPEVRNAMDARMWQELDEVFSALQSDRSVSTVVIRGAGGFFCAGGDLKERAAFPAPSADGYDPMYERNRNGGRILSRINSAPQLVVCAVEGAAIGGGFGLVAVSDIALCVETTKFSMPEVTLGVLPAQIIPFVTRRIGETQVRRLALSAERILGAEAASIGIVHKAFPNVAAMNAALLEILERIQSCDAQAIAETKALIALTGKVGIDEHLDIATQKFVEVFRRANP